MRTLERVDVDFFTAAPKVVRTTAVIRAPRSAVFGQISGDPAGWGNWFPGFSHEGRWESPPPHGVGSIREVRAFRQGYRETMLAWDEGERWAFRVDATDSPMFAAFAEDYRLADEGPGTRLTWVVAYQPNPLLRPVLPVAPLVFRAMVRRVAAGLNRVLA